MPDGMPSRSGLRRLSALLPALLVVAGCAVATPQQAVAQDEEDGFTPTRPGTERLRACPAELQKAVPGCAVSLTLTKKGEYEACVCDANDVKQVKELPIPPGKRNLARGSSVLLTKITEAGNPEDPCLSIKIDGQKIRLCW